MDGFFARDLGKALKGQSKDTEDFVVIGHPKACTLYSLEKLEKFIENNKESNRFIRFSDRLD